MTKKYLRLKRCKRNFVFTSNESRLRHTNEENKIFFRHQNYLTVVVINECRVKFVKRLQTLLHVFGKLLNHDLRLSCPLTV